MPAPDRTAEAAWRRTTGEIGIILDPDEINATPTTLRSFIHENTDPDVDALTLSDLLLLIHLAMGMTQRVVFGGGAFATTVVTLDPNEAQ